MSVSAESEIVIKFEYDLNKFSESCFLPAYTKETNRLRGAIRAVNARDPAMGDIPTAASLNAREVVVKPPQYTQP